MIGLCVATNNQELIAQLTRSLHFAICIALSGQTLKRICTESDIKEGVLLDYWINLGTWNLTNT